MRANWPETPFILLLEGPEEEAVAESERLGAADFVLLENTTRLVFAVKCALEERKLRKENARLQLKLQYSEKCLQDLVEHSVYGIFHAGMDGKFVSANETLQKILVCSNFDELQQLNLAELDPPALAVLDVVMPNMGGAAAAELLRRDPALPVLFTSGFSENANTAVAGAPGSHYLQKPYSPTSLASMIREILDS